MSRMWQACHTTVSQTSVLADSVGTTQMTPLRRAGPGQAT